MCGIYGIWARRGASLDVRQAVVATTTLRHRGPDDEGYLLGHVADATMRACGGDDTDPRLQLPDARALDGPVDLVLGFRRLAIVDLSVAGHQPMMTDDGRYWMVFNGEIYNYRELREELVALGHAFHGHSDSEVLLAAYVEWGSGCLSRLNGMWAVAIWDVHRRELFLARDRFGVKPLFYSDLAGCFRFASEVKALVGRHGVPFVPNDGAVDAYLRDGVLPSPTRGETFFENVRTLPPGHLIHVSADAVRVERYYTLPRPAGGAAAARVPDRGETVAAYRKLFDESVQLRLHADVPVGTCLSGGLDSSAIVAESRQLVLEDASLAHDVGDRIKTFSAVYDSDEPYDERGFIDIVAAATGADAHFTVPTIERLGEDLDRLVWHQDEPFGGLSIFAQWCVMATVREAGVTVLLDGQGADEALAGYQPYGHYFAELLGRGRVLHAAREARHASAIVGGGAVWPQFKAAALAQLPMPVRSAIRARGQRRIAASGRPADPFAGVMRPEFTTTVGSDDGADGMWHPTTLSDHLSDSLTESSLPHLLRYEDRNSMAFSVEARVPYVDYRLVEFACGPGRHFRFHHGWSKWLLRAAVEDLLPSEIVWRRRKVGFEVPEADWIRALLRSFPPDWHEPAGRYIVGARFTPAAVEQWIRQGLARRLWRFVNLALWMRVFSAA